MKLDVDVIFKSKDTNKLSLYDLLVIWEPFLV